MSGYRFDQCPRLGLTLSFRSSAPKEERSRGFSCTLDYSHKEADTGPPPIERGRYLRNLSIPAPLGPWNLDIEHVDVCVNWEGRITHAEVVLSLRVLKVVPGNSRNILSEVQVLPNSGLRLKVVLRTVTESTISSEHDVQIPGLGTGLLDLQAAFI